MMVVLVIFVSSLHRAVGDLREGTELDALARHEPIVIRLQPDLYLAPKDGEKIIGLELSPTHDKATADGPAARNKLRVEDALRQTRACEKAAAVEKMSGRVEAIEQGLDEVRGTLKALLAKVDSHAGKDDSVYVL